MRAGHPNASSYAPVDSGCVTIFSTGNRTGEYTNATTTQMLNVAYGEVGFTSCFKRLDLPTQLLQDIVPAGAEVGRCGRNLRPNFIWNTCASSPRRPTIPAVRLPALRFRKASAYISSGTWSLVGIERNEALVNEEVAQPQFYQ